jgi:hypothetical protein
VRLRELSFRRVWFRVRYVAGVRGGTGLVRIGRRARFFGSPREGFPILGIVDRDARAIAVRLFRAQDPPGLFGRSRRALGRTSSSSWATLTESSSASDRDTTSTLRAPPSPKWAHTSMSFFALMALGEAITRGAFATARIGSGGIRGTREAADDARGRASLRGAADCDGAANPPEDLPPTFVVALGKTWREFRTFRRQTRCFFRLRQRSPVSSGHHIVRRPRRERLSASTRGRRDTTMRIYTPAEVRPEPPPTHPRDAPLTRQARETSRTQKRRCRPRASRAESGFLRSTRDRSR